MPTRKTAAKRTRPTIARRACGPTPPSRSDQEPPSSGPPTRRRGGRPPPAAATAGGRDHVRLLVGAVVVGAASSSSSSSAAVASASAAAVRQRRRRVGLGRRRSSASSTASGSSSRGSSSGGWPGRGRPPLAVAWRSLSSRRKSSKRSRMTVMLRGAPAGRPRRSGLRAGGRPPRLVGTPPARRRPACSASSRRPAPAPSERPAGRRAGRVHGCAASTGGTGRRSRSCCRPPSSRTKPESPPETSWPSRTCGGSGGGPAAGAISRQSTIPSSSATHRTASHQPSISVGRSRPARRRRSPRTTSCSRTYDAAGGGSRGIGDRIRGPGPAA